VEAQKLDLEQALTEGVLCSGSGTDSMPSRRNTHHFANPSSQQGHGGDRPKPFPSTDAIMPSIAELASAAGLSKLKQRRLLDAAAKDLRQGRIQVPSHIPATEDEQLKWVCLYRLAQLLGEEAFDLALAQAFQARAAA